MEIFWHNWSNNRPHTTSEWVSQFFYDKWRFQFIKQTKTEDFYVETQIRREFTMISRLQWILQNVLVFTTSRMRSFSSMDVQVHKYPVALWLRTQIFLISITAWSVCYDFFITTQIIVPDCWDWCAEIYATIHTAPTEIGAPKYLEREDNLTA